MTLKLFQSVACAVALLFAAQPAVAQPAASNSNDRQTIKIGDEHYTRGEIIEDFLRIAFSNAMWNEDANYRSEQGFAKIIDRYIDYDRQSDQNLLTQKGPWKRAPWWAKHIHSEGKWPTRGVINKWSSNIIIGLDWPTHKISPANSERYQRVLSHLKTHTSDLARYTGMPVTLYEGNDSRDQSDQYARLRIIAGLNDDYRSHAPLESLVWSPAKTEWLNFGGVLFESSDYGSMDGYILPLDENHIDLSICKIRNDVDENKLGSLIAECLVRGTGLPGLSNAAASHLNSTARENAGTRITPYDGYMIQLLYCPKIKAGMDKNKVFEILAKSDSCFPNNNNLRK